MIISNSSTHNKIHSCYRENNMDFIVDGEFFHQVIIMLIAVSNFVLIGWLLTGFQASSLIWCITLFMTAYLVKANIGGVILTVIWGTLLSTFTTLHQLWFFDLPKPIMMFRYSYPIYFLILLSTFIGAYTLAKISLILQKNQINCFSFKFLLTILMSLSLSIGWLCYPKTSHLFFNFIINGIYI